MLITLITARTNLKSTADQLKYLDNVRTQMRLKR